MNLLSFYLALIFVLLAVFVGSAKMFHFLDDLFSVHPFTVVLAGGLVTFVTGIIGFMEIQDGKSLARSVITVGVSSLLVIGISFVLGVGRLFS
ncbi:hypothetical protein IMZ31_21185 (plasmid) [Pontibacillus sp. ALD_SL1]|uniref:hypothetical protein n=1 Tax=Pontibacillus sp. ALD_SL1 TaxID=2777185 RepID=UPI001A969324|nr:hypothetical protein [Pontibacillus sp. ALD_SL1]QST03065.1 hypothetical protein IMZ31_21185 [Pontibacillus sp. ALD_SL1]